MRGILLQGERGTIGESQGELRHFTLRRAFRSLLTSDLFTIQGHVITGIDSCHTIITIVERVDHDTSSVSSLGRQIRSCCGFHGETRLCDENTVLAHHGDTHNRVTVTQFNTSDTVTVDTLWVDLGDVKAETLTGLCDNHQVPALRCATGVEETIKVRCNRCIGAILR